MRKPCEHGGGEKNLTLLEHLQELRNRLMICTVALVLGMVASFYKVTNWTLEWMQEPARDRVENFHLIFTQPLEYWTTSGGEGEGIGGALSMRAQADEGPIVYIEVADIDAALSTIESAGGRRVTERMPIPSVGYSAVFEDTEGNRLGLFQTDPSAAMPV